MRSFRKSSRVVHEDRLRLSLFDTSKIRTTLTGERGIYEIPKVQDPKVLVP